MEFPHLKDSNFPDVKTVDVYKYANEFDYQKYDTAQMHITMCNVPWDMGEAHIGNRTISGIGNVVFFNDKTARDAWFNAIPDTECYRFTTDYKDLHRDNKINVPIPFDVASKFNYLVVKYEPFANADDLVMYEQTENTLNEWFWFIREVEFKSPNTSTLHLLNDAWQTFIYDLTIEGMILERGHAPLFETTATQFLANPINNNKNLLAPDIVYGVDKQDVYKSINGIIINNDNMMCVFVTTSAMTKNFGSSSDDSWNTPGYEAFHGEGVPSAALFACTAANYATFIDNARTMAPQFIQSVKCVFFIPREYLLFQFDPFTFCNIQFWEISSQPIPVRKNLLTLSKNLFGYDSKYENLAKLYTSPYAYIEISDEKGNISKVNVENTSGAIYANFALNCVYPYINISALFDGIGKAPQQNFTFKNISDYSINLQGNWCQLSRIWDIPCFGMIQDASVYNYFSDMYNRKQLDYASSQAYSSEISAALAAQANQNAIANTTTANAALQVSANSANNTNSISLATSIRSYDQSYNNSMTYADNSLCRNTTNADLANDQAQAAINGTSTAATGAVNAVGSALSGDISGAITGAINTGINTASIFASSAAGIEMKASVAQYMQDANSYKNSTVNVRNNSSTLAEATASNSATTINNNLTTGTAANSSATQIANATRSYNSASGIATNNYNTAQNQIQCLLNQAKLNAPMEFGQTANASFAASRPMGIFASVVTQPDGVIAQVGDEMLRYGYYFNQYWPFDGQWNIGAKYTYWKLTDFWVRNLSIPDMYVDRIRFFLFGGVTVWRNPSDIGNTSIYQNGV